MKGRDFFDDFEQFGPKPKQDPAPAAQPAAAPEEVKPEPVEEVKAAADQVPDPGPADQKKEGEASEDE